MADFIVPPPSTSAAALSAAVDSLNQQGTAPHLAGGATSEKHTPLNASRSSGGGPGEELLAEKLPTPERPASHPPP